MTRLSRGAAVRCALLLLSACSSAPAPKAESVPTPAEPLPIFAAAAGSASESPDAAAKASAAGAPEAAAEPSPPEPEPVPKIAEPKFLPIDVITGPEVAFLIDYANSGASDLAKRTCADKPDQDADKKADCLTKAREKFGADVLRFRKDDRGRYRLVIYRRSGSSLAELFSGPVDLKENSPHSVQVGLKGGSGQRPILRDKTSFELKVPNGYSIEIEDSTYGRLPYDAKVGLVAK